MITPKRADKIKCGDMLVMPDETIVGPIALIAENFNTIEIQWWQQGGDRKGLAVLMDGGEHGLSLLALRANRYDTLQIYVKH